MARPAAAATAFFGGSTRCDMRFEHIQTDTDMPHPSETTGEYMGIAMFFGLVLGLLAGTMLHSMVLAITVGLLLGALLGMLLDHHYKSEHREETFPG
jgi:UDP-N-acetylmuramyl pentapeptide phosphotransferase/UDP-N-acetylglucosamine-1-phosphate transferase